MTFKKIYLKFLFFILLAFSSAAFAFEPAINLADLELDDGFKIYDSSLDDRTDFFVSNVGDVNADGIDDLAVSSFRIENWDVHTFFLVKKTASKLILI